MPQDLPRRLETPEAGFYATRLVSHGPEVPVELILTDGHWVVSLNGVPQGEAYPDKDVSDLVALSMVLGEMFTHPFVRVLTFARRITEDEYNKMLDAIQWCITNRPDDPRLAPTKPIDLNRMKSLW
jgi:hypothetical protein